MDCFTLDLLVTYISEFLDNDGLLKLMKDVDASYKGNTQINHRCVIA